MKKIKTIKAKIWRVEFWIKGDNRVDITGRRLVIALDIKQALNAFFNELDYSVVVMGLTIEEEED